MKHSLHGAWPDYTPDAKQSTFFGRGGNSLNEDDCCPLLLSQRERGATELDIRFAASKAEVADVLNRHDMSEDDFLAGFPERAKAVQTLPDESPPVT